MTPDSQGPACATQPAPRCPKAHSMCSSSVVRLFASLLVPLRLCTLSAREARARPGRARRILYRRWPCARAQRPPLSLGFPSHRPLSAAMSLAAGERGHIVQGAFPGPPRGRTPCEREPPWERPRWNISVWDPVGDKTRFPGHPWRPGNVQTSAGDMATGRRVAPPGPSWRRPFRAATRSPPRRSTRPPAAYRHPKSLAHTAGFQICVPATHHALVTGPDF